MIDSNEEEALLDDKTLDYLKIHGNDLSDGKACARKVIAKSVNARMVLYEVSHGGQLKLVKQVRTVPGSDALSRIYCAVHRWKSVGLSPSVTHMIRCINNERAIPLEQESEELLA